MKFNGIVLLAITGFIFSCGTKGSDQMSVDDIEKNEANAKNPGGNTNGKLGTPKFAHDTFNFGKIEDGETVAHEYKFHNTGEGPLTISGVQASCGCTSKEYSKGVIAPGEEGFVKVIFDSKGKGAEGGLEANKAVTVSFSGSTVEQVELRFRAKVFASADKEKENANQGK